MKIPIIFLLATFILRCNIPEDEQVKLKFDQFIFSHSEEYCDYSLKFTNTDTVFMQKRFPAPKETFFALTDKANLKQLDSFINVIQLTKLDTMYFQAYLQDGRSYKFFLKHDTTTTWTFVYGKKAPKFLYDFGDWLRNFKEQQNYHKTDRDIDFGDLKYIELPSVPPPPKIENSR